jgi:hypothetical protein
MKTANANAIKTVVKDGYYIMTGHAILFQFKLVIILSFDCI